MNVFRLKRGDRGSRMQTAATVQAGEAQDRAACMEAIVTEHETSLLRYATRLLNSHDTAQDVVQNVFIKLYHNWPEGMQPSPKLTTRPWTRSGARAACAFCTKSRPGSRSPTARTACIAP